MENRTVATVGQFLDANPDLESFDLMILDLNAILRGKRIDRGSLLKSADAGIALPGSLFSSELSGETIEATGLGFAEGDADRVCRIIPGTLCRSPWADPPGGQALMTMHELDGRPFYADPRHALAGVCARFDESGLTPVVAVELEFYLIDPERRSDGSPQPPCTPGSSRRETGFQVYGIRELDHFRDFLTAVRKAAELQGVPATVATSEYSPGQFEINLQHVRDPMLAADHAVMLKRIVRAIAIRQGMEATFMARPYNEHIGSGLHVHASVLNDSDDNIFESPDSKPNARLRHAVGGLLETLPESIVLLAPNANSYRRFRKESFVPRTACWGYNNRTVALRIPSGPPEARRIEHRLAGADANPYAVLAAVLAGLHHGLEQKVEPLPMSGGNSEDGDAPELPVNWADALSAFSTANTIPEYLGADFCRHYGICAGELFERHERHVTPREHALLLGTI